MQFSLNMPPVPQKVQGVAALVYLRGRAGISRWFESSPGAL